MPYMNQAIIMGHLGKDAETRMTGSGTSVTTFSVATSRRYKQGDEWKDKTTWHNVVAWKLHEKTQAQLTKGAGVLVIGEIDNRSYEDKATGQKRYITEIVSNDVKLLNPTKSAPGGYVADDSDTPF